MQNMNYLKKKVAIMKIKIFNDSTNDCVEFSSYETLDEVLNQLSQAKNMIEDMLHSGLGIIIIKE